MRLPSEHRCGPSDPPNFPVGGDLVKTALPYPGLEYGVMPLPGTLK